MHLHSFQGTDTPGSRRTSESPSRRWHIHAWRIWKGNKMCVIVHLNCVWVLLRICLKKKKSCLIILWWVSGTIFLLCIRYAEVYTFSVGAGIRELQTLLLILLFASSFVWSCFFSLGLVQRELGLQSHMEPCSWRVEGCLESCCVNAIVGFLELGGVWGHDFNLLTVRGIQWCTKVILL